MYRRNGVKPTPYKTLAGQREAPESVGRLGSGATETGVLAALARERTRPTEAVSRPADTPPLPPVLPCISLSSFKHCHSLLMRHTISVLVENRFGVLARIAGMFSGRGFNIDSLNVAPTTDFSTSKMTIVVRGDDTVLEQVTKQLNKLVDVIEIQDFRDGEYVDRELVMLRVKADSANRSEVMQICDIFRAKIVDVQPKRLAIEITGNESKITKFLKLMENFGISDLTRTGKVAMARAE